MGHFLQNLFNTMDFIGVGLLLLLLLTLSVNAIAAN